MSNITQIPDRLRNAADRIKTEHEAFAAISTFRSIRQKLHSPATGGALLQNDIDLNPGLLGISVPEVNGGADVGNAVLADLLLVVSEVAPHLTSFLSDHFRAVEAIRLLGDTRLRAYLFDRILSGDRLAYHDTVLSVRPDGSGYRFADTDTFATSQADIAFHFYPVSHDGSHHSIAITTERPVTGDYIETGRLLISDKPLEETNLQALTDLLDAATATGKAQSKLEAWLKSAENDAVTSAISGLGSFSVSLQSSIALIRRAGQFLDGSQVTGTARATEHAITAALLAQAAARNLSHLADQIVVQTGQVGGTEGAKDPVLSRLGADFLLAFRQGRTAGDEVVVQ